MTKPANKSTPPAAKAASPRRAFSDEAEAMLAKLKADLAKPATDDDVLKRAKEFARCADLIHREIEQSLREEEMERLAAARARLAPPAPTSYPAPRLPPALAAQLRARRERIRRALRERASSTLH